jgi:hypothetical protein
MVHQAPLDNPTWSPAERDARRPSAAAGVRDGVGELLYDIVSLGELQAQLLAVDAQESMQKAKMPLIMLGLGAVVGLASVPILLMALAEFFIWLGLNNALAYLLSGVIGAALAGLLAWLGYRKIDDVIHVFNRSRFELAENVRWIKYAVTRGRRPPRESYSPTNAELTN